MQNSAGLARIKARRKFWLDVHGWRGLIAGVVRVIFGIAGRIRVLVRGLACPVLSVTAPMRWLQKRRVQVRKNRKLPA